MLSGLCILTCFMFSLNSVSGRIFLLLQSDCFPFWERIVLVSVIIKKLWGHNSMLSSSSRHGVDIQH